MKYDRREFENILRSRGVTGMCGECGYTGIVAGSTEPLELSGGEGVRGKVLKTAAVACQNCGHLRLFALQSIGLDDVEPIDLG